jgi:hypothetical protein
MVDKASQKPLPFSLIALATIFSANPIPTKRSNNLEPEELADELVFKRKMEINCQYQQKKKLYQPAIAAHLLIYSQSAYI